MEPVLDNSEFYPDTRTTLNSDWTILKEGSDLRGSTPTTPLPVYFLLWSHDSEGRSLLSVTSNTAAAMFC